MSTHLCNFTFTSYSFSIEIKQHDTSEKARCCARRCSCNSCNTRQVANSRERSSTIHSSFLIGSADFLTWLRLHQLYQALVFCYSVLMHKTNTPAVAYGPYRGQCLFFSFFYFFVGHVDLVTLSVTAFLSFNFYLVLRHINSFHNILP